MIIVATLALGLWPRQGFAKVCAKSEAWKSHFMFPGVYKSVKEWTHTVSNELPLWELDSRWTSKSSEGNYKGQNSLVWRVFYIIRKLLKLKFLKWVRMTHLGIYNISYGQKRGRKSNYQFDSPPLKVRNHSDLLTYKWCATYCWKALEECYNFALDFISIGSFHKKVWTSKVIGVPI